MNLFPPNVDARATTVQIGDSVAFANMFEASDLDGNPIQTLRFRDNSGAATSGFFTVRGVRQDSGIFIEAPISELSFIRYQSGLIETNETFSVQVGDGERFSQVDTAFANTIPQNFFPPMVTGIPGTVLETEKIAASSLFSVSDPEDNPILRYFFLDAKINPNGGHFVLNNERQQSGVYFLVEADQLENLYYVGGHFGQTEMIGIAAFDGEFWSDIEITTATTTPNLFRPVTTVFNVNSPLGRSVAAASLFSFSDADGNTLKTVGFRDTGTTDDSGFFTVNGVRQDAGTFFFVTENQLPTVRYEVADSSDSEILQIFTTDGRFASTVESLTVTAIPRPRIDVDNFTVIVDNLEQVDFVDLITQVDNGPNLTTFQVVDQNESPISARLLLNGQRLEQGIVHTLNETEFNSLKIEGGVSDDRSADQFLVRGKNQLFFTEWQEFRINTEPVANKALNSNLNWGETLDNGEKYIITYTFIDGVDDVDGDDNTTPPVPIYYPDDADERDDPFPLGNVQRAAVREALESIEKFADIDFVEVPFEITASEATMTFGLRRGFDAGVAANARFPFDDDGRGNVNGDIWYNRDVYPETQTFAGPGSGFYSTTLHEVGHTLGFKHPRAAFNGVFDVLPVATDLRRYTIMSTVFTNPTPASFGIYDILEVQRLYRANEEYNLGNDHYFFNPGRLETVYDAGGRDTINLTNSIADESIDLHEGAFSTFNGVANSIAVALGTDIENARGGSGADMLLGNSSRNLLFGNDGNDILEGDGGNDVLRGGANRDTYVWRTGDGRDRIDEQQKAGIDSIHIFDDTALDSLENDLVFRRFGKDLRIDLRFNRMEGQGSIRVKDQQFGGSRVETLRLFTSNGEQIGEDIDLDSIFQQADTSATFFKLTDQQTEHGFIAVPFTA